MIYYKTHDEIEKMRDANDIVSRTLALVASLLKPGVTGIELDRKAEEFIRDSGGIPAFLNLNGFPATLCISPNQVVVHGIPDEREFKEKELVSIDCGVNLNGYFGDCAYTFILGEAPQEVVELCSITQRSLYKGIEVAIAGNRIGNIGHAIQELTEKEHGYGVVRELVGHGIGRSLHEKPEVPNYGKRGRGKVLKEGMVIAIEPMINLGTRKVTQLSDGWTIATQDQQPSAHYEHSVAITKNGPDILSTHAYLEEEIKKNYNIMKIPK